MAGITRLTTEIIAGTIPDILDLTYMPYDLYVARGLLIDLNPLIDADPLVNRSDLMESVLRADEIDGRLYRISPTFSINAIFGRPEILGRDEGWTLDEFRSVLEENPQADIPFGIEFTNTGFLRNVFEHNIDRFVDWASVSVHFDDDEFAGLLELANTFPSGEIPELIDPATRRENITFGRQIMVGREFGGVHKFQSLRLEFGGDIVLKGWPGSERSGSKFSLSDGIAITINAEGNHGAWEFVRTFLTMDFQRHNINIDHEFPINRVFFGEAIEEAIERIGGVGTGWVDDDGNFVYVTLADPLTEEEAEQIMAIIDSISSTSGQNEVLWNIISESASNFFNGIGTAQDAARIIQSRAEIYISEQGG